MIRLVVDASVAVKWVLKEPDSDAARRIAEQAELLAPDLLWAELGSLLWRRQRQGELSASDARGMLLTLRAFPVPSRSVTASTTVSIWRSPIGRTAAW
jgi:predicted nucleic acid-binding protein